jgi:hypothetical protein
LARSIAPPPTTRTSAPSLAFADIRPSSCKCAHGVSER